MNNRQHNLKELLMLLCLFSLFFCFYSQKVEWHGTIEDEYGKNISQYNSDLGFAKVLAYIPQPKPSPNILKLFQPRINWAITSENELVISYDKNYEIQKYNEKSLSGNFHFKTNS